MEWRWGAPAEWARRWACRAQAGRALAAPAEWARRWACRAQAGRALAARCRRYPHHRPPTDTPLQAAERGRLIASRMASIGYFFLFRTDAIVSHFITFHGRHC